MVQLAAQPNSLIDHEDERKQLAYVQALDLHADLACDDPEDSSWIALRISNHTVRKHHGNRKVFLRVHWFDGTSSWILLDAMRYNSPTVVVHYATDHNLTRHPDFLWTHAYTDSTLTYQTVCRSFKISLV